MKIFSLAGMVFGLCFFTAVTSFGATKAKIEEQVVAPPYAPGTILTLSAKGMRLASTHTKDNGKFVVMIDGVEGAEYDQVLLVVPTLEVQYFADGRMSGVTIKEFGPVAFSPDGKHSAFAALLGEDVVVILDGKEIFRAKQSQSAPPVALMQFTPDSQHLYFYKATGDTMQSFQLMMDGKAVTPAFDQTPPLIFNADGSHWLLSGGNPKKPLETFLIVDGKDVGYSGDRPRFTPDGKHVVSIARTGTQPTVLRDGKPMLVAKAYNIDSFKVSPAGDVLTIAKTQDHKSFLYLNDKLVADSEGVVGEISFSKDGKHWAAKGMTGLGVAYWIMLDGKKHKDYKIVGGVVFSADSTKCAYFAQSDQGWRMVVNGEEGEANAISVGGPYFAATGDIMVYTAGPNATKVYYNGKVSPPHHSIWGLELSPDGSRCAYYAGVDALSTDFTVDGAIKSHGGSYDKAQIILFSPDSKHLAATARRPSGYGTIYVDDYFFPDRLTNGMPKAFTPDSQHLVLAGPGPMENGMPTGIYYLDGEPVVKYSTRGMKFANSPKMIRERVGVLQWGVSSITPDPNATDWEFQPDGSIVFIVGTPGPAGYGPIKRIKVTPTADTSVATWVAEVKAAEEKGIADAAAAKQKAADDAAAAAAKKKADYDAAVAAKAKARQDAVNAQKLKVLNAQRAKQHLPPLTELP